MDNNECNIIHQHDETYNAPIADNNLFYIGTSVQKGRGLFAMIDIIPFTIIHVAPCIVVTKEEYETHMKYTIMEHYLFNDIQSGNKLLALGYGSLFNHDSTHPNVIYHINSQQQTIVYKAGVQMIPKGTELCISYGSNLWFDDDNNDDGKQRENGVNESSDSDNDDFLQRIHC